MDISSLKKRFQKGETPATFSKYLKWFLSCFLVILGAILTGFLIRETWHLVELLLSPDPDYSSHELVASIVVWFLYFEFIALVVKYFESKLHFPLRYFIYIGITAIIRLIILDHENPTATLIYSLAILLLLGALYISNTSLLKRM